MAELLPSFQKKKTSIFFKKMYLEKKKKHPSALLKYIRYIRDISIKSRLKGRLELYPDPIISVLEAICPKNHVPLYILA
jgi:hypothetical protein